MLECSKILNEPGSVIGNIKAPQPDERSVSTNRLPEDMSQTSLPSKLEILRSVFYQQPHNGFITT